MGETDFVLLWKEHYEKIDQSLHLNRKLLEYTISEKAEKTLRSLVRSKMMGMAAGVLYMLLLGIPLFFAVMHYRPAANYFIVSIGAIFLINIKAIYDYIRHLALINSINYDDSVVEIQQKLNRLQLSIARHVKIMFLQLPFWTTFFLSGSWFPSQVNIGYVILQIFVTLIFTIAAIFLYRNLTPKNMEKKWVRSILSGAGGKKVRKAIAFYKEIEAFKDAG
jgi:uncharacterized membrane protein